MPFEVPTLAELAEDARAELNRLPGADSRLRRSLLDVWARIVAAAVWGIYGFASWIAKQVFPDTAELENLERWAAIWGLQRIAATFAAGSVTITGTNGTVVPTGTGLRRVDGVEYVTTANATISGGTATASVEAALGGEAGNAAAATVLTFIAPVSGAASTATVTGGGIIGGEDQESDTKLRARLLDLMQAPPHGGSEADYEAWALAALAGLTRVWVTSPGIGLVSVLFVMDGGGGGGGIIPSSGQIATVQAYIDARRPVTADVTVAAPTTTAVAFTIDLGTDDTAEIRAAVQAELTDLFVREGSPGGTILLSHIREAISQATGETDHILTVPAANVVLGAGAIPVLGTVTWV
jgi:uncharacterized phage protein gp47/JayE